MILPQCSTPATGGTQWKLRPYVLDASKIGRQSPFVDAEYSDVDRRHRQGHEPETNHHRRFRGVDSLTEMPITSRKKNWNNPMPEYSSRYSIGVRTSGLNGTPSSYRITLLVGRQVDYRPRCRFGVHRATRVDRHGEEDMSLRPKIRRKV
jgi:hypothetical protein